MKLLERHGRLQKRNALVNNMYIITNGQYFCKVGKSGGHGKTKMLDAATTFETEEEAQEHIRRCPGYLKNYEVEEFDKYNQTAKSTKEESKRRKFNSKERMAVYSKDKGRCQICGRFVSYNEYTIDHIIPLSKGGTNDMYNLQCTCKVCNLIKQDILPEDLMDKLTEIIMYQMTKKFDKTVWRKMKRIKKKRNKLIWQKTIDLFTSKK